MTNEEIKKVAGEYAHKKEIENPDIHPKTASFQGYYDGYGDCNKHWEEKTRWIPVTERLPEVSEEEFVVFAKNKKNNDCEAIAICGTVDVYYLVSEFTHWREIE